MKPSAIATNHFSENNEEIVLLPGRSNFIDVENIDEQAVIYATLLPNRFIIITAIKLLQKLNDSIRNIVTK